MTLVKLFYFREFNASVFLSLPQFDFKVWLLVGSQEIFTLISPQNSAYLAIAL